MIAQVQNTGVDTDTVTEGFLKDQDLEAQKKKNITNATESQDADTEDNGRDEMTREDGTGEGEQNKEANENPGEGEQNKEANEELDEDTSCSTQACSQSKSTRCKTPSLKMLEAAETNLTTTDSDSCVRSLLSKQFNNFYLYQKVALCLHVLLVSYFVQGLACFERTGRDENRSFFNSIGIGRDDRTDDSQGRDERQHRRTTWIAAAV